MKRAIYSEFHDNTGTACFGASIINLIEAYTGYGQVVDRNALFWRYARSPFTDENGSTKVFHFVPQIEYVTKGVIAARLLLNEQWSEEDLPARTSVSGTVLEEFSKIPYSVDDRCFIALKKNGRTNPAEAFHAFVYHRPSPVLGYGHVSDSDGWLYTLAPNEDVGIIAAVQTTFQESIDKLCIPNQ